MRNKVAKKLRKEAGVQTSTSNRLEYEYLKKEHKKPKLIIEPNIKISNRSKRLGKVFITKSTINTSVVKKIVRRKLKA